MTNKHTFLREKSNRSNFVFQKKARTILKRY